MQRRKARQLLLKTLFQQDFRTVDADALIADGGIDDPFLCDALHGIQAHRNELDALIEGYAQGWSLERLVSVDRNILRLALYELFHTDTPHEVVINEAVELAKRFGTEHSAAFINGVLDRIWKELPSTR